MCIFTLSRTGDIRIEEIAEDKSLYLQPGIPARLILVKGPTASQTICA